MARAKNNKKTQGDPLFIIKLQKGLAERKRLPLAHVLSVLDELRQLVSEIGRDLQRRRGTPNATGDFGLEIEAGESGIAFRSGSVETNVALTERPGTGVKAIEAILATITLLNSEDFAEESADKQIDRRIVRRLSRIARVQKRDRTEMKLGILKPGQTEAMTATFGSNGIAAVRSLQAPTFRVDGTTIYGKLFELVDKTKSENVEERGFWGELFADDGEKWRVHFKSEQIDKVTPLFAKQVVASGSAVYFRIAHPKLLCNHIEADPDRDYETEFDELFGSQKDVYKTDLETLLKRIHGD